MNAHPQDGDNNNYASFTNEQVEKVCEMLEIGHPDTYIYDKVKNANINLINNIRNRRAWNNISCKYKIPELKPCKKWSDNDIHAICSLIEARRSYKEIYLQYEINYITFISLRKCRARNYIADQYLLDYDLSPPLNMRFINIVVSLRLGDSKDQVAKRFGISSNYISLLENSSIRNELKEIIYSTEEAEKLSRYNKNN